MLKKIMPVLIVIALVLSIIPMSSLASNTDVEVKNYEELKAAIEDSDNSGKTIKLTDNITLEGQLEITQPLIINGNSKTITGNNNDSSICFVVDGAEVVFQHITMKEFGGNQSTASGEAIIKVLSGASADTKVIVNNVSMSDFRRSAIDVRSGELSVIDTTIDCTNTYSKSNEKGILVKGISIGLGKTKTTASIVDTTITNSDSTYDGQWSAAGLEVYSPADVAINGINLSNCSRGIHVDNYYGTGVANVTIKNANIDTIGTENSAVKLYSKDNAVGTANVYIEGGVYNDLITYTDKTDKDTITVSGGTFANELSKDIKIEDGKIQEVQENNTYIVKDDNTLLKETIAKYENIKNEGYTDSSWDAFVTAKEEAKKLLRIAASKTEMNLAIEKLENSFKKLEKQPETKPEIKPSTDNDTELDIIIDEELKTEINNNKIIKEYIESGKNVDVSVTVKDMIPEETEKEKIQNAVKDATIGKYFDISILVKGEDGNTLDKITDLSKGVKFTIKIDENLKKDMKEGYEREYKVIRVHNGEVEVLETTVNGENIEFYTDKFSTYAISYEDKKIENDNSNENEADNNKDIVQTGDYIYVAVGTIVVLAVLNVVYFTKKMKGRK